MSEWRPIETAQKDDGGDVLLFVSTPRPAHQVVAHWAQDRWLESQLGEWVAGTITHWMPLPAPPLKGGKLS
jgi:hypothetical protein